MIPFLFISGIWAIAIAAVVSLSAHFAIGAARSLMTIRPWWRSGLEIGHLRSPGRYCYVLDRNGAGIHDWHALIPRRRSVSNPRQGPASIAVTLFPCRSRAVNRQ
ncbi:VIT1/CCC1 transporter family protein [Granulicella aggregans]|uniref:VIT1/CCC1 transporter family protein n=1 Tax=Granulicella aggregans TaxID=474949 RepID=UPI0021E0EBF7|nr:VIT1/CCC1 transporter family protein [Granulicella aggregans]